MLFRVLLVFIVALHMVGCVAMFVAAVLLPVSGIQWQAIAMLEVFLCKAITDKQQSCILTDLENLVRAKLGEPPISGFISHYIFRVNHA